VEGILEFLRRSEFDGVKSWFGKGKRVVEIGGASGYQASLIAAQGCEVISFDLATRPVPPKMYHPVQDYDGKSFGLADKSVDIVYSSNVLEHIRPLEPIFAEMRRVLKPDGLGLHLIPSPAWRSWTSLAHYLFVLQRLVGRQAGRADVSVSAPQGSAIQRHGIFGTLKQVLFGPLMAHGEYANAFAELYYFSEYRWRREFQRNGFEVVKVASNNLFYTGYSLFPGMSLQARQRLARYLGGACHVYVTRPLSDWNVPVEKTASAREPAGVPQ
jgi:SAM-dependent methyltransferase